jgi:hypothetical protein
VIFVWTQIRASSYRACPFPPDVWHVVFVGIQVLKAFEYSCRRFRCSFGLVFKYNYKSAFLEQVGLKRCLVVLKGTLRSGDLPRLKRRLDCGRLCRASASDLGTDIGIGRLLSVFSLLSFLSFSCFRFSCYVGQCLTLASSVHCQEVMKSVGMLCNILWWVGQYHKC